VARPQRHSVTNPGIKLLVAENDKQHTLLKEKIFSMKGIGVQKEPALFETEGWAFVTGLVINRTFNIVIPDSIRNYSA